jgi:hypothetical protein
MLILWHSLIFACGMAVLCVQCFYFFSLPTDTHFSLGPQKLGEWLTGRGLLLRNTMLSRNLPLVGSRALPKANDVFIGYHGTNSVRPCLPYPHKRIEFAQY